MSKFACEYDIYHRGHLVRILGNMPKEKAEQITITASTLCGFKIDWHYAAGRVVVKTLGDVAEALKAVNLLAGGER